MISATGDKKRDEETLKNTIQNQHVPKVPDTLVKEKPKKSLKINLDSNVTYAFEKQQSVEDLIDPNHIEVRSTLKPAFKLKSIMKGSDKNKQETDV